VPVYFLGMVIDQVCTVLQLGRIRLDILKDKWRPALQIRTVLLRSLHLSLCVIVQLLTISTAVVLLLEQYATI
jgi:ubiquitin-protein ligase